MAFHHIVRSILDPLLKHPKTALTVTSVFGVLMLERERRNREAERLLRPAPARRTRKHTGRIDAEFLRRLLYILRLVRTLECCFDVVSFLHEHSCISFAVGFLIVSMSFLGFALLTSYFVLP